MNSTAKTIPATRRRAASSGRARPRSGAGVADDRASSAYPFFLPRTADHWSQSHGSRTGSSSSATLQESRRTPVRGRGAALSAHLQISEEAGGFLIPNSTPRSFHLLAKPTGSVCNLDCAYCFFLEKEQLYPDERSRMSDEMLERYIRQLIEAHRTPEVDHRLAGRRADADGAGVLPPRGGAGPASTRRPGMTVRHTIQTNGTKINGDWARFFAENGFLVGLSIDGPRELHDAYRRDKAGKPTFDKVMRGLAALREHGVDWNALTTVNAANEEHPAEVYRFLRDECGCEFIQFIPIVERPTRETACPYGDDGHGPVGHARRAGARSSSACSTSGCGATSAQVFVQLFDVALANWYGEPSGLCVHTASCGTALAMEFNGDVYACDHFVEPEYLRGNIHEHPPRGAASARPNRCDSATTSSRALPRYCLDCDVRFACHGGCPKDRFVRTPDGRAGAQLPLPRLQGVLPSRRRADAPHVRAAAPGARRRRRSSPSTGAGTSCPREPGAGRPPPTLSHPVTMGYHGRERRAG